MKAQAQHCFCSSSEKKTENEMLTLNNIKRDIKMQLNNNQQPGS